MITRTGEKKKKKKKERRENWREFVQAWLIACVTKQIAYDVVCMCVYNEKERDRLFPVFESTKYVRVQKKKKMGKKKAYRQQWAVYAWKTMIFLLICAYPLFFLHSPRLAPRICVRVSNDAIQNAIDERATRIWKERERMTAPFVVHHVERISFLSVFFLAFSSHC
jgi:hypothetical protein